MGAELLELGIRVAEVAEDVAASSDKLGFVVVVQAGLSSLSQGGKRFIAKHQQVTTWNWRQGP